MSRTPVHEPRDPPLRARQTRQAARLALLYGGVAGLWILLSDRIVEWLVSDPGIRSVIGTVKGGVYVAGTTVLLYWLLRRWAIAWLDPRLEGARRDADPAGDDDPFARDAQDDRPDRDDAAGRLTWALTVLVVVLLTVAAGAFSYLRERERQGQALVSQAELRATMIVDWLRERTSAAEQGARVPGLADQIDRWVATGDEGVHERLQSRLGDVALGKDVEWVRLVDARGTVVVGATFEPPQIGASLREALDVALAEGQTRFTPMTGGLQPGAPAGLQVVAPVPGSDGRYALVLDVEASELMDRVFGTPDPADETPRESYLVRRVDDRVVWMQDRHPPMPLSTPDLGAARVLRGDAPLGTPIDAHDYAGRSVLGVVRKVDGTDWYLITKLYRIELLRAVADQVAWIGAAAALALAGASTLLRLSRERRRNARLIAQQAADQVLAEQAQMLGRMSAMARIGAWGYDPDTGIVRWTEEVARIKDETPVDSVTVGRALSYYHGESRRQMEQALGEAVRLGTVFDLELELVSAAGRRKWVRVQGSPEFVGDRVVRLSGFMQDVTMRRAAEDALRASERQLRAVLDTMAEGLAMVGRDGRYTLVNTPALRILHTTREQMIGLRFDDPTIRRELPDGQPYPAADHPFERLRRGAPSVVGLTFTLRSAKGERHVVSLNARPLIDDDGFAGMVATFTDVTEKHRADLELARHRERLEEIVSERTAQLDEARQRAEAANLAKTQFLANMTHEIRTPLAAILGLADLGAQAGGGSAESVRAGKIGEAARHLLSIVDDILDLSKIEAGRLELEHTDFLLAGVLDHVRSIVASQAEPRGIALAVDIEPGLPTWLHGDPTRLRQALLNYAGNAVKFTDRGAVTLRARLVDRDGDDLRLRFEVEDTGIGIEPQYLPRLFDSFEQADTSTTRRFGGTGLGLSITRRLAALMDGEVGARSVPGQGSLFWFTAQLTVGQPPAEMPVRSDQAADRLALQARHAGAMVLLVDDHPMNREVASEQLHALGLAVTTAADGQEAVAAVVADPGLSLVLMDLRMPRLDGLAATRRIRQLPGRSALPVIAMTANAFEEDRAACREAGMDDFLAKPVAPDAMAAVLLRWLDRRPRARRMRTGDDGTEGGHDGRDATASSVEPSSGTTASPAAQSPAAHASTPAPESPQIAALAALAAIPGVEHAAAMAAVRGNVANYRRLLGMFIELHGTEAARLRRLATAPDERDTLRDRLHAVRGVTGYLGAAELQRTVEAAEAAVREAADDAVIAARVEAAATQLEALVRAIGDAVARHDAVTQPESVR